jgi:hypothetical protein
MAHSSARTIRRACFLLILGIALVVLPELARIAARPDSPGNLAAQASLRSSNTVGVLSWLVRGSVAPEGTSWETARVVVLGDRVGRIQLDFGEPVEIAALALQADHDDEYQVRTSSDAARWTAVWQVPAASGSGLRTRHQELSRPVRARYLDLSNGGETPGKTSPESVISAIRVYSTPLSEPGVGLAGAAESAGFPWLGSRAIDVCKVVLGSLGAFLLVLLFVLDRRGSPDRRKRLAKQLLVAVTLVAALGWWDFFQLTGEKYGRVHRNYWDVYHYYLGSKYSNELGYTNLYRCHLAAEVDAGLVGVQLRRPATRDLSTNDLVRTPQVLDEGEQCRERFSSGRWEEFKRDHAWFRSKLPPAIWLHAAEDHGYNASPVFAVLGGMLANLAPMSDLAFVLWISIDTLLLVGMGWLVWSTFGWRASCAAGIFFTTNLVAGNHFTGGAFLRQDWLFLSLAGVCCLKREKTALAGFLLVYAASLRIFPGFLLVGVALNALTDMLVRRSWVPTEAHRRLAIGALAGGIVLMALSFAVAGRTTVWNEFAANTAKHHRTPQVQNVGLRALVHHIDRADIRERPFVGIMEIKQSYSSPWRPQLAGLLALLFLPLLILAVAAERDWVAAILGITWLPFVTDINNYYWSLLMVFGLLLVRRPVIALGFAPITVVFAALGLGYGYRGLAMFTWSSLALLLFFLWVAILFAAPKWRELRRNGWRAWRQRPPPPRAYSM